MKEFSDKLTEDDRKNLQSALDELRKAHSSKEVSQIDESSKKLDDTWAAISTRLYQQQSNESNHTDSNSGNEDGDVQDTSYEEVK